MKWRFAQNNLDKQILPFSRHICLHNIDDMSRHTKVQIETAKVIITLNKEIKRTKLLVDEYHED